MGREKPGRGRGGEEGMGTAWPIPCRNADRLVVPALGNTPEEAVSPLEAALS